MTGRLSVHHGAARIVPNMEAPLARYAARSDAGQRPTAPRAGASAAPACKNGDGVDGTIKGLSKRPQRPPAVGHRPVLRPVRGCAKEAPGQARGGGVWQ